MFRCPVASAGAGSEPSSAPPRVRALLLRPIYTAPEEEPDDEPEPPPPEPIAVPPRPPSPPAPPALPRVAPAPPPPRPAPVPPVPAAPPPPPPTAVELPPAPPERAAAVPIHPDEDHTWPAATRPAETITSVVSQLRLPGALGRAGRQYLQVADLRECDMPSFELSFAPQPTPPARDGGGGTGGVTTDGAGTGGDAPRTGAPPGAATPGLGAAELAATLNASDAGRLATMSAAMARLEAEADAVRDSLAGARPPKKDPRMKSVKASRAR